MSEEIDAFHEAGHVVMARHLGCRIDSVTIEPDRDDSPRRLGDTQIAWRLEGLTRRSFCERAILVALAGPVAEMMHSCEQRPIPGVPEWSLDWSMALQAATELISNERQRLAYLEKTTKHVFEFFDQDQNWAALGALVDALVAHETLDAEQIAESLDPWMAS